MDRLPISVGEMDKGAKVSSMKFGRVHFARNEVMYILPIEHSNDGIGPMNVLEQNVSRDLTRLRWLSNIFARNISEPYLHRRERFASPLESAPEVVLKYFS